MQSRRTPGGAGPGKRPGRPARPADGATRATGGRSGAAMPRRSTSEPAPDKQSQRARQAGLRPGQASAGRGGARPAGQPAGGRPPSGRRTAPATRTRAPQPHRFTGRAAVLGLVLLALLLAYAYPVRVYLAQQAEIAAIEERQAAQRVKIAALTEERALWDDPEYVKAQARERLHYTLPGEMPIIVLDPDALAGTDGDPAAEHPANPAPWYEKLWSSIGAADK